MGNFLKKLFDFNSDAIAVAEDIMVPDAPLHIDESEEDLESEDTSFEKTGLKSYEAFKDAVGVRESGDKYNIVNTFGYLGRYQFGRARLSDFGLCKRIPGKRGYGNKAFEWEVPFTEENFLNNSTLQDAVFDVHVADLAKRISRKHFEHLNKMVHDYYLDLSGAVGCSHLLGMGGLRDFIDGDVGEDAYGTPSTEYIELFCGYAVCLEVPTIDLKEFI